MTTETFQIEGLKITFDFQYGIDILPQSDLTGTFFYIKSPVDLTLDKNTYHRIKTGIFMKFPDIVEQRKQDNVINVSKFFVQGFVGIYNILSDNGLVQTSSPVVYSGQQIEMTILNHSESNYTVHKGDIIACLTLVVCPRVQLVPQLSELSQVDKK